MAINVSGKQMGGRLFVCSSEDKSHIGPVCGPVQGLIHVKREPPDSDKRDFTKGNSLADYYGILLSSSSLLQTNTRDS